MPEISTTRPQSNAHSHIKLLLRTEEDISAENEKMLITLQSAQSKIKCWTSKKILSINEMLKQRKKEEEKKILEKFKEITRDYSKIYPEGCRRPSIVITSNQSSLK